MKVIATRDFQESSAYVAQEFIDLIRQKPCAKLGLATGGSAEGVYACLVAACAKAEVDFSQVSTVNLDEYLGLDGRHPQSYRYYMNHHLFDYINIDKSQTYVPDGRADPEAELQKFTQQLHGEARVDLQLLGVGANGHIGFNEPAEGLEADPHIEDLIAGTIEANSRYFSSADEVPRQAFTQGVGDILKAQRIVLIATGESKVFAMRELLRHSRVNTRCPVTLLKLHPDVTVVLDRDLQSHLSG